MNKQKKELEMKKTLIGVVIILIAGMFAFPETKIGIVNGQKLIEGTKKGSAITAKLEALGNRKQAQLKNMQAEIAKLEKELGSPALNAATRDQKSLTLQNKRTAVKRFIEDTQREIQIKTEKEMTAFKTEIYPIIQQIGKAKGFSIIVEAPSVTYFDPTIDISAEIIKIMNSK
jgi:outer membrane protein